MLSHEDELIHFLNGFNSFGKNEIFLDENGDPTDHFLEALKSDHKIAPTRKGKPQFLTKEEDLDALFPDPTEFDYDNGITFENPKNTAQYRQFAKSIHSKDNNKVKLQQEDSEEERYNQKKKTKPKKIAKSTKPSTLYLPTKSSAALDETHIPKEVYDTTEIEVETQSKLKALNLRLSGQRNTIKSLEQQLAEATEVLTARNKQLAVALARLKALEPRVCISKQSFVEDNKLKAAEQNAEKYKKQADLLQAKFLDEQAKKQRAEEKARVLKEYAEKSKNRCQALESQNAELNGLNVELNVKMEKYRKGYKEQAADVTAHKTAITERDSELTNQHQRIEKVESALRNCQMELEHCREQLRVERAQHKVTQSKVKQLDIQLEIVHEKEATKKAEQRLTDLEGFNQRHQNIARLQHQQHKLHDSEYYHDNVRRSNSKVERGHRDYYSDSEPVSARSDSITKIPAYLSPKTRNREQEEEDPKQWVKFHRDSFDDALDRDVVESAGIAMHTHEHTDSSASKRRSVPRYVLSGSSAKPSHFDHTSSNLHSSPTVSGSSKANFIKNKVAALENSAELSHHSTVTSTPASRHTYEKSREETHHEPDEESSIYSNRPLEDRIPPSPKSAESNRLQKLYSRVTAINNNTSMTSN